MRRSLSAVVVAAALILGSTLVMTAQAGSRAIVPGTIPWSYGGAFVEEGVTYDVDAVGYVQTAKIPYFHVPGISKSASGPEGQPNTPCLAAYETSIGGQCALEGANFGALIGMVIDGNTGMALSEPFLIGGDPTFEAPATGILMATANDLNLTYYDNNGQFTVAVTPQ